MLDDDAIEAPGSGAGLGWGSIVFATLLFVGVAMLPGLEDVLAGRLVDTDAWTWTHRATDLRVRWEWFDPSLPRVHPPAGHGQHWSRPFDALLLVGGLLGEPLFGFGRAILYWGMVVPVLLGLGTMVAFHRLVPHGLDAVGTNALLYAIALQPALVFGFAAARPDHQALIGLLLVLELGLAMRAFVASGTPRQAVLAGTVAALGLWVGMEFLVPMACAVVAVGARWIWRGGIGISQLARHGAAFTATATLALLLEHGPRALRATQLDELSWIYVLAGLLLAVGCWAAQRLIERRGATGWRARAIVLTVLGVVAAAVLLLVEPDLVRGPLGQVDPLYGRTRLANIAELQPTLVLDDLGLSLQQLAVAMSMLPFAVWGLRTLHRQGIDLWARGMHLVVVPAVAYLFLALGQGRWTFPLALCLVVPAAHGLGAIMHKVGRGAARTSPVMAIVGMAAALWWLPASMIAEAAWPTNSSSRQSCDLSQLVAAVDDDPTVTILAPTDWGPEILVRTRHGVMSIPNHRHQPGYTATWEAFSTTDAGVLQQVLADNDVGLVAVCTDPATDDYGEGEATMYDRLVEGTVVSGLRERELPPVQGWSIRLYEVVG